MSVHLVWDCNGHRNGDPCRGKLHVVTLHLPTAQQAAERAGWRRLAGAPFPAVEALHLCPSRGHDEDEETRAA